MAYLKFTFLILMVTFIGCTSDVTSVTNGELMKNEGIQEIPNDSLLKEQLNALGKKDQTLRFILPDVTKRFGANSEEEKYFWSLILKQDSVNEYEIVQIIDQYGWLGKSRVGSEANQALWLIIQHAPLEVQEHYLPLLKESVAQEESEGWHLAFLEDRILMRNGKDQIYGSQAEYNKETEAFEIYPIQDVERVNERREKIGLNSIEEHAESNGYVFDQKK